MQHIFGLSFGSVVDLSFVAVNPVMVLSIGLLISSGHLAVVSARTKATGFPSPTQSTTQRESTRERIAIMLKARAVKVLIQLMLITIGLYYLDASLHIRRYIPFLSHRSYDFQHLHPVEARVQ